MIPSTAPTNRLALTSFLVTFLTAFFFCVGLAPIPFTALVCYPAAFFSSMFSLVMGFSALKQVRASGEKGRGMALVGIGMGVLTILAMLCFTAITFFLLFSGADYFWRDWNQFHFPQFNL